MNLHASHWLPEYAHFLSYREALACKVSNFLKWRSLEYNFCTEMPNIVYVYTQGGDAEDSAVDDIFSDTDDWDEDIKEDKKPTP